MPSEWPIIGLETTAMMDNEIPETFKEKLIRALRAKAVLTERSKQLKKQVEDLRTREQTMHHLASELLERQRELNFMLHRASSVLHQLQDTNLALSAEFTHIVKELPPAKDGDWEQTIERVNDLFKKTHELADDIQDDIFRKAGGPGPVAEPANQADEEPAVETPSSEPQPEPEPEMVAVETQPADEPQVELQMEVELEPQPIAEAEIVEAAEDPEESEESRDDQIEQLFRQIRPIELKPAPNGKESAQQGFFSRLFRKNKTAV